MKAIPSIMIALSLLIPLVRSASGDEPTPVPMKNMAFQLPLSDGTTTSAQIIQMEPNHSWLVYLTKSGHFVSIRLMTTIEPPSPVDPPDPVIVPQKLQVAILADKETLTLEQITILSDPAWRKVVSESHTFLGIYDPKEFAEGGEKPPERLLPFLKAAEGKQLPRLMFSNDSDKVIFGTDLPPTSAEIITILKKYGS
ncbi:MAG: hypothetical protein ACOYB0_10580 [Polynucleobacter sp.]